MPDINLVLLALPVLVIMGMIVQLVRARRRGLRGRAALIAVLSPVRILMQGEATGRGLPAERLEILAPPNSDTNSTR